MSIPSLDAKVYELRGGESYETNIRDVIAKGSGNAYEKLQGLESWPHLLAKYEEEISDPLLVINDRIRLTYKQKMKAEWWLEDGLTQSYGNRLSVRNLEDARADCTAATAALDEAMKRRTAYLNDVDDRWNAVAPPLSCPQETVMSSIGDGYIPIYPWPSDDTTITTEFRNKSFDWSPIPVAYPEETIMRFCYSTSPMIDDHYEIKAIVIDGRCVQLSPSVTLYETVENWVESFPTPVRARFTVALPAA
jgi:hypothetical protein